VLQHLARQHAARGVAGRIEHDDARAIAEGVIEALEIEGEITILVKGTGTGTPPATPIIAAYVGKPGSG